MTNTNPLGGQPITPPGPQPTGPKGNPPPVPADDPEPAGEVQDIAWLERRNEQNVPKDAPVIHEIPVPTDEERIGK